MFTVNRGAPRRGVILLIVLSLLAMFGLVGIGFLVITSHERRAAKTQQKADQDSVDPRKDPDQAVLQILRGDANNRSVIGVHNLLEDLYGNNTVDGTVFNVLDPTVQPWTTLNPSIWNAIKPQLLAGGHIVEFAIRDFNPQRYAGRLITFTGGPCAGVTSRVVGLRTVEADMNNDGTVAPGELVTWVDSPDPYGRFPRDPALPGRPVWKLQVQTVGVLPMGPDGKPGVPYQPGPPVVGNEDGDGFPDNVEEFFYSPLSSLAADDDLDFGDPFIINGAPFAGAGFGLPDLTGGALITQNAILDAAYNNNPNLPFALLPNPTVQDYGIDATTNDPLPTMANEDYDAVDYQNMLLAMVMADGTVPSPSLHRPALINYWFHRMVTAPSGALIAWPPAFTDPVERWRAVLDPVNSAPDAITYGQIVTLKRGFMLNPLPEDHPEFDGGNSARSQLLSNTLANLATLVNPAGAWIGNPMYPGYWEAVGPWDVDNDGDGEPDSIWVDLGLPVRELPDGRKYKPLFAILCTDLDGRLNLNAAGCSEQLRAEYDSVLNPGNDQYGDPRLYAGTGFPTVLPRGQGSGPAEINLRPLFTANPPFTRPVPPISPAETQANFRNLLLGLQMPSGRLNGRYGEMQWLVAAPLQHLPAPGRSYDPLPTLCNDPISANWLYGFGDNYYNSVMNPNVLVLRTEYGTPVDLKATMTYGLDLRGQPIYDVMRIVPAGFVNGWNAFAWAYAGTNDPYELDLTRRVSAGDLNQPASEDAPFTIGEFERVLRPYDIDTQNLPDRLVSLAPLLEPQLDATEHRRHKTTVASWDIPCPTAGLPTVPVPHPNPPVGNPGDPWPLLEVLRYYVANDFGTKPVQANYTGPPGPAPEQYFRDVELYQWGQTLLPPRHTQDMLVARMYVELRNQNPASANPVVIAGYAQDARNAIEGSLSELTSTDLLAGLKMDVNRPFGNGKDDVTVDTSSPADGIPDVPNGVVDEPGERLALAAATPPRYEEMTFAGVTVAVAFDHDNDGILVDLNGDGTPEAVEHNVALADPRFDPYGKYRQAYARHLYVLMMALTDPNWYPPEMSASPPSTTPVAPDPFSQQERVRARAIAQWAVNVVDFRDRDAIMTPFEYDIAPFTNTVPTIIPPPVPPTNDPDYDFNGANNTWDIDGIIDPTFPPPSPLPISPDDASFHRGLVWGTERPELLITETLSFHDRRTEDLGDDGGRVNNTPPDDTNGDFDQRLQPQGSLFVELFNPQSSNDAQPGEFYYDRVSGNWRGGVILNQGTPAGNHPVWRMAIVVPAAPAPAPAPTGIAIADPDDPATGITIERSMYFRDPSVMAISGDGQQFYTTSAMAPILNNRYAVIGPGDPDRPAAASSTTKIGFRSPLSPAANQGRRIVLNPDTDPTVFGQVEIYGEDDGTNPPPDDLARPEPNPYPPAPGIPPRTEDAIWPTVAVIIDQPRRLSVSEPIAGYSIAGAYDSAIAGYRHAVVLPQPQDLDANEYWTGFLDSNDTHAKFRILHLQRLADPLRDYDPQTNPYRTVDSAQIDLTAFNGVTNDNDNSYINPGTYAFFTRERGETTPGANNLWQVTISPNPPSNNNGGGPRYVRSVVNHFFDEDFSHTLGYVNEHFGDPRKPDDGNGGTTDDVPDAPGYKGDPTEWLGDVARPFPWLTWNNRPFVSQLELAMVPASSSSKLLVNYTMNTGLVDPYQDGAGSFGHLLNFFHSDDSVAPAPPPAHFYRLLEFVHVPSRFVGTQDQFNPVKAGADYRQHGHHPPFHWASRYREPGRINMNTMFNRDVYLGLMNNQPVLSGLVSQFAAGRQAFSPISMSLNPAYPTRFANPYRSFSGLERVPPVPGGVWGIPGDVWATAIAEGVNATALRRDYTAPVRPLFACDVAPDDHYNGDRSPYFRYQGMQRLGNLATTRSNVYAVWITAGYFEVQRRELQAGETAIDRNVYLEGYTLGRELGGDTGEVRRHRAFYVIDRSIPVGFQRGKDLNAEKTIVLKRFIE